MLYGCEGAGRYLGHNSGDAGAGKQRLRTDGKHGAADRRKHSMRSEAKNVTTNKLGYTEEQSTTAKQARM